MCEPAKSLIEKCGGARAVADMVGVDISRVHRWTYPRSRGGTDGAIPTRHQTNLLTRARERGIDLRPEDFFSTGMTAGAA